MDDLYFKNLSRRDFLKKIGRFGLGLTLFSVLLDRSGPPAFAAPLKSRGEKTDSSFTPSYLKLHRTGELKKRAEKLWEMMGQCELCPRKCGAGRLNGGAGICRAPGTELVVASASTHFGEERPLVGKGGSGTIFFSHCNLRCVFCQNWDISHMGRGAKVSISGLADLMISLQEKGCHNINFVTPTHYSAHILKALDIAAEKGLSLPVVWNTSGWERVDILQILDGIVDIYMPDFKYFYSGMSAKYSAGAESYPEITKKAILEMDRQTGDTRITQGSIAHRGLIIRVLVMPGRVSGSGDAVEWIARNLPEDTYVNIMAQYSPKYKAYDYPDISRRITRSEYDSVAELAKKAGLTNLDLRGYWWLR